MADRQSPIGFLGFGEAGFHLARGLRGAGAPPLIAFDIKAEHAAVTHRPRRRPGGDREGIEFRVCAHDLHAQRAGRVD